MIFYIRTMCSIRQMFFVIVFVSSPIVRTIGSSLFSSSCWRRFLIHRLPSVDQQIRKDQWNGSSRKMILSQLDYSFVLASWPFAKLQHRRKLQLSAVIYLFVSQKSAISLNHNEATVSLYAYFVSPFFYIKSDSENYYSDDAGRFPKRR